VSSLQPPGDGRGEELRDVDPAGAHEEPAGLAEGRDEGVESRERIAGPTRFHLDGGATAVRLDDEVDLPVALAPVVELEVAREGGVREVRADRRLHQPAPELRVRARLVERVVG